MPKTSLPAAAEGLPAIHRRSVLKGALVTGFAAGGTCRVKAAPAEPSPELARLIAAEREAAAFLDATSDLLDVRMRRFEAWKRRSRGVTFQSRIGKFLNPFFTDRAEGVDQLMAARASAFDRIETALVKGRALDIAKRTLDEDCAADCAAWNMLHMRIAAKRAAFGIDAAEDGHRNALAAWRTARQAAMAYPALTAEDVAAKAAWLRSIAETGDEFGAEDGQALLASFVRIRGDQQ
ncbi:hypothetical protein [Oricola sp.]|uniref:hypothetical protein n=1 Tax=Oricola sp. TaxID=1979950 RepID=UPI0025DE4B9B|nr:hypothetical protein [Oricola sp.]MCI5078242.1 hypothetical protein [Oricola sp.]